MSKRRYDKLKMEIQEISKQENAQSKFREWIELNKDRINHLTAFQQQMLLTYVLLLSTLYTLQKNRN